MAKKKSAKRKPVGIRSGSLVGDTGLTQRAHTFALRYLVSGDATDAARHAKYSAKSAHAQGNRLLKDVRVKTFLDEERAKVAQTAQIDAVTLAKDYQDIIQANPNDLMELRRVCCRYCYGVDNRRMWTAREFEDAQENFKESHERWLDDSDAKQRRTKAYKRKEPKPPDIAGGLGFDPRKAPNPDCMECFGEGELKTHFKDTRSLTGGSLKLYAGVKQTKDGLELKVHDQMQARAKLAEHLGMSKSTTVLVGPNGGPVQHQEIDQMSEKERNERAARYRAADDAVPD